MSYLRTWKCCLHAVLLASVCFNRQAKMMLSSERSVFFLDLPKSEIRAHSTWTLGFLNDGALC